MTALFSKFVCRGGSNMTALEIQVNFSTGERAGGIDPRDPGLECHPTWQNLDEGIEIRIIKDGRDVEQYRNIPGITVLEGAEAINARIKEIKPTTYAVANEALFNLSLQRIDISDIDPTLPPEKQLEELYNRGVLGIRKTEPKLL